ncbi:CHASE2 domain-containing protein [Desulfovulcanus sp.]
MKNKQKIRYPLIVTICLLIITCWAYLARIEFLELLEFKAYDLRLKARGKIDTSGQVAIVAIDEQSLERIGRWPWTRSKMAELVEEISQFGPKAVGYDISFFDPEKNPAQAELVLLAQKARELNLLPNPKLRKHIKERLIKTNPDLTLALALKEAASPQILGYYFNLDPQSSTNSTFSIKHSTLTKAAWYPAQKFVGRAKQVKISVPIGYKARYNISLLAGVAAGEAYFNVIPDPDGVIRRYNLAIKYGEKYYQPLAAAMVSLTNRGKIPTLVLSSAGLMGVEVGNLFVPTDEQGRMLINYRGPEKSIVHIPAWKFFTGQVREQEIKNKWILVGVTAPAVYDLRVTPYGVAYPGIEIQATALDTMLRGDFLLRPNWAPLFDLGAIILLGLISLFFLWRAGAFWTLIGFLGTVGLYLGLNFYLFKTGRYWLNVVYPLLGFGLNYLSLNIYRFIFADRQKRQIRQAFSKYLDPNVVEQVVSNPEKLKLGGEKLELSVLFSDIRGFTSISERLKPEQLVSLLNEYLTEMTRIVLKNKGLLDKYIGDAVMAVFGAPLHHDRHAMDACNTALEMMEKLKELNEQWRAKSIPLLDIGIGINTGEMVAGNMGSIERFDYTVMGDNVNLASRLEGLNKVYGTNIIVSEFTKDKVEGEFWFRSLDLVRVKGKENAVEIFELLGSKKYPCPVEYMEDYNLFMKNYRLGEFVKARDIVDRILEKYAQDKVVQVYRQRLDLLLKNPPTDWDGVYTFTTK